MIKINFIADEILLEKNARIRRRAFLFYVFAWGLASLFMFIQYQNNQSLIATYNKQINKLKVEIDYVSPQFRQAVQLYQQRTESKRGLEKLYQSTVEPEFIFSCLKELAVTVPRDFWLDEVRFSAIDKSILADNNKKKHSFKKQMIVKGNLLLNGISGIESFQETMQKNEPFSLADCQLDLNEMNVIKLGDDYSHNFEMSFFWTDQIF